MKNYLKRYKIQLEILTPVHIGAGRSLSKKEYIYDVKNKIAWIPNEELLLKDICVRKLGNRFEQYMLNGRESLLDWMKFVGYKENEITNLCDYQFDCTEALQNLQRPIEIQKHVRDAYGLPYIPGSSLKGAIRTALLGHKIITASEQYKGHKIDVLKCDTMLNGKPNKKYLKYQGEKIEVTGFRTLNNTNKVQNALNDELQGVYISDSKPLAVTDLILCQKIDMNMERRKNALNILRECLKPGTKIEFEMTIDTSIITLTDREIQNALDSFVGYYRNVYVKKFIPISSQDKCNLYLGGGCGFATKTVLYQLLGEKQGIEVTSKLMHLKFKKHGHQSDVRKGVSPHMLKCTNYGRQTCEMGKCRMEMFEI